MREKKKNACSDPQSNGRGSFRFQLLISICGVFVAGVGLVALLGWALELPVLSSLGSGRIPVAPSTAGLFVVYAGAIFLRTHFLKNRVSYWTGIAINSAGALLAALLFVLSLLGIRLEAEHLGFNVVNKPGEIPVGHISPVTAFCFLLSSLSYLLSLPSSSNRRWPANIAWWLACCLITAGSTLVLAYLYGTPMLYGSVFIPPAALTSMAFIALGTALFALASPLAWSARPYAESTTRASYTFFLVFVFLTTGIVIAGYLYYRNYEIRHRTEVESQLSAVADLKADELVRWRKERLADAGVFYNNVNFSESLQGYLKKPKDAELRKRLKTWMNRMQEVSQYDQIFLLDESGTEQIAIVAERTPIASHVRMRAAETLGTKKVAFEDFYLNEHNRRVYLAVLVPISEGGGTGRALGTLIFRIDPEQYLYPFLKRWPTPSGTAETLLVRREGNNVLFLNELRFRRDTALNLRRPLDHVELPAVQAALGREGIVEGWDYRGVPVIANVRTVPESPWFLVARMDKSEMYAPVRERLWLMIALVTALLIGAGAGTGLIWKRQRSLFYREKYDAAEALRLAHDHLRRFVDSNIVGVVIASPSGGVIEANDYYLRLIGYTREEFEQGMVDWRAITPPEWLPADEHAIEELRERGTCTPYEKEYLRRDGTRVSAFLSDAMLPGPEEQIAAFVLDITERKKADEALGASERQYRQLVNNALVGVYRATQEGKFLYVNDALARMLECEDADELLQLPVEIRYKRPEDRKAFLDILKEQGKVPYYEVDVPTKTGKLKTIMLSAILEDGIITGMVTDITERKHLESQLRHAQKMDAVGTLAGGIAHDFNNILNVIIGYGTMVMDGLEADSPSKGRMNEVLAAAERAATLTRRLLTFSRKQLAEVKPININELMTDIQKMLGRIIGEDIDFNLNLEDRRLVVMADAGQIEQVLLNLAANARDAMPNGGRLTIGTGREEVDDEYVAVYGYGTPGMYALITVADTGQGIDAETQKKIFEPFFTTKGIGEGTGLGLAISYGIIKQHNGYIKVYSEPGQGAVFKIYLPLIEEAASPVSKTEAPVPVKGGNETVLVAEDDPALRTLSRIVLESFGYSVITAEDGEDAITKFMEFRERIHLVMLDMIMPKKNGKEVGEVLRKENPLVKILFMSGYTMDIIKNRELTESGFEFIHKPIRPQDLLIKVREILDK
ncbi:MAG: PAS domain S-box protein [Nitrospirae bacterium]|nr:PAS domain S-box protein [Nitrospirota bacterium]